MISAPLFGSRFIRLNTQLNVAVDPASFTLAGLGQPVGAAVSDNRISRRIGYWTGTGLSEHLPPKKGKSTEPQTAPSLVELMAVLENDPASEAAREAATSILLNTPDGPDVETAAGVILREHVQSPDLANLCNEMERLRHRCAKKLLETVLEKNPNQDVQLAACFTLATLLKDEAQYGKNKKATADAEKLFERVVMEFAGVRPSGPNLARKAKTELSELRRLSVGKPAPDFDAEDLDGQEIKLSDYRGKVVVVAFWYSSTVDSLDEHQKLFEPLHEKPFAYISINCDNDLAKAKATIEKHQIAWPTIWDGRSGPIAGEWNINLWTSVFVLDRHGVIRYRQLRGKELVTAIETLLREGS